MFWILYLQARKMWVKDEKAAKGENYSVNSILYAKRITK